METPTITRFYRFLDSLGLFGEFWVEYYKIRCGRRRTLREFEYFLKLSPKEYLTSAFPWTETNAGYHFWKDIDRRWQRRLLGK